MAYFSDILEFPEQCRLGGVWLGRWADEPGDPEIAIGHFLVLPEYQDGSVECRFLTAHLPFQAGGFHGVFPDLSLIHIYSRRRGRYRPPLKSGSAGRLAAGAWPAVRRRARHGG